MEKEGHQNSPLMHCNQRSTSMRCHAHSVSYLCDFCCCTFLLSWLSYSTIISCVLICFIRSIQHWQNCCTVVLEHLKVAISISLLWSQCISWLWMFIYAYWQGPDFAKLTFIIKRDAETPYNNVSSLYWFIKTRTFTICVDIIFAVCIQGRPKSGATVLQLVTLEILVKSASNLAQVKVISFLTLTRNYFIWNTLFIY